MVGVATATPAIWARRLHNPFFILGTARSGTSLLARLLGSHRDVANWSEANIIWDPNGHPWGGEKSVSQLPDWVDPAAYHNRWWHENESRQQDICAIFGLFQTIQRKRNFLNKTPYLVFRIPQIMAIFPDAHFIYIVRDGRAVVSSRLSRDLGFGKPNQKVHKVADRSFTFDEAAMRCAEFWKENAQEVATQDAALGLTQQGRLFELSYEQLCGDPNGMLRQICDFMKIDFAGLGDSSALEKITDQNFKWRENLSSELVEKLVAVMEPIFSERGYTNN